MYWWLLMAGSTIRIFTNMHCQISVYLFQSMKFFQLRSCGGVWGERTVQKCISVLSRPFLCNRFVDLHRDWCFGMWCVIASCLYRLAELLQLQREAVQGELALVEGRAGNLDAVLFLCRSVSQKSFLFSSFSWNNRHELIIICFCCMCTCAKCVLHYCFSGVCLLVADLCTVLTLAGLNNVVWIFTLLLLSSRTQKIIL